MPCQLSLPACLLRRVQSVQNVAARLTYWLRRSDHITDALLNLQCLRIVQHVKFKIAILIYTVLHGQALHSLGLLTHVADLRGRPALRSASSSRLDMPYVRLSTIGSRAFPVAGPQVWNNLPEHVTSADSVRTFSSRLKTPNAVLILLMSALSLQWFLSIHLGHFKNLLTDWVIWNIISKRTWQTK